MKHILVTTDFSPLARLALGPAAEIARHYGARLTLAHVLATERPPRPVAGAPYYKVAKSLYDADESEEQALLAQLREQLTPFADLQTAATLGRGEPVEALLAIVERERPDLIVISSKGRTGLSRLLLGSVAEELARRSPIPVLIWKDPAPAAS